MYSFNKLATVADCDVLLAWAQKEKSDLAFKKTSEERLTEKYSSTSVEIEAVLQGVITEIAALDMVISMLPEGSSTREDGEKKKKRLEYKQFLLENRKESYGSVALLGKELDLERINKELTEVDAFIAGVTSYKNTL